MTESEKLPGLGIELKINGKTIMKPPARSIDGQYQLAWGYREGRYLTPLGEIGLEYVQYADEDTLRGVVLIDCSKAEVIQNRYPWMGDRIVARIKKNGKGSIKLQSGGGWGYYPTHLNVRLEGMQDREPRRSHWVKEAIERSRTLAGPNGYRYEWRRCTLCMRGYGHIPH